MNSLWALLRELAGLFVDDGSLALQIVTIVLLAAISSTFIPTFPLATGGILLFGCLGALLVNAIKVGRR
jgi:hypothetical protein